MQEPQPLPPPGPGPDDHRNINLGWRKRPPSAIMSTTASQDGLSWIRLCAPQSCCFQALTCAFQQGQEQLVLPIWKESREKRMSREEFAQIRAELGLPCSPSPKPCAVTLWICRAALKKLRLNVGGIPETLNFQGTEPQLLAVPQLFICTHQTETETSSSNSRARAPSPHLVHACGHTCSCKHRGTCAHSTQPEPCTRTDKAQTF